MQGEEVPWWGREKEWTESRAKLRNRISDHTSNPERDNPE